MTVLDDGNWRVSVDELLRVFREALLALVPIVEQVHMHWKEPEAYDDWDAIAAALYNSFVVLAVENAADNKVIGPIVGYDIRLNSYERLNFVANRLSDEQIHAFICFETRTQPFDTCLFAIIGEDGRVIGNMRSNYQDSKFKLLKLDSNEVRAFETFEVVL